MPHDAAHRHRPRRHQDRGRRRSTPPARCWRASASRRRAIATTTRWRRSPRLVAAARSATSARGASVGVGMPGAISPATGLVKNANSTWLNGRPLRRRSRRRARPAGPGRQRRRLLRAVGSHRWRGGRGADRLRRDPRHRHRRRRRRPPAPAVRTERDRRRVGPQPAAVAARRRAARAGVLLRPRRLHRDVPVGAGASPANTRQAPDPGRRARRRTSTAIAARAAAGEALAEAILRPLRGPAGPRPRLDHQRPRSRTSSSSAAACRT